MPATFMLTVAVLAASGAPQSTEDSAIVGTWKPVQVAGDLGPDLTITRSTISFGKDREPVKAWRRKGDALYIVTSSGLSYSFRQTASGQLCLQTGLRSSLQAAQTGDRDLRCYKRVKIAPSN